MKPAWDLQGQYSTDIFTKKAVSVIKAHNDSEPLFLYLAHAAVHSGNAYNPLPAPEEVVAKFDSIVDPKRRRFAGRICSYVLKYGTQMLENFSLKLSNLKW